MIQLLARQPQRRRGNRAQALPPTLPGLHPIVEPSLGVPRKGTIPERGHRQPSGPRCGQESPGSLWVDYVAPRALRTCARGIAGVPATIPLRQP